jgi:hypothetical protein
MNDLKLLTSYPSIDVKICTPVTKINIRDIKNIARLLARWGEGAGNRVFYNIFQTFPRSMIPRGWDTLLVSERDFSFLRKSFKAFQGLRTNFLSSQMLDRLYVLIFPDGGLYVPSGKQYNFLGEFLEIDDLQAILAESDFAAQKHRRHSQEWEKMPTPTVRHCA